MSNGIYETFVVISYFLSCYNNNLLHAFPLVNCILMELAIIVYKV